MARPVRPGTGTTHRMSKASQPGKQNGTLFANPIRASSPKSTASTGRTEDCSRPTPNHQISLAMREPSTEVDCINRPDRRLLPTNANTSNFSCNAGAIHRRHMIEGRLWPTRVNKRHRVTDGGSASGDRKLKESAPRL